VYTTDKIFRARALNNLCNSLQFEDDDGCSVMVEFTNPYDESIIRESGSAASPARSWYIHPMLSFGNCPSLGSRSNPFNSEGVEILNFSASLPSPVPNGDFPQSDTKTVRAKLKCNNGSFMLDVLSNYSFWDACDGGTGDESAIYLWNDIEIPINNFGYPDGVVSLGDPTSAETCSNGGIELLPYNNINIKFTYIGTSTAPSNSVSNWSDETQSDTICLNAPLLTVVSSTQILVNNPNDVNVFYEIQYWNGTDWVYWPSNNNGASSNYAVYSTATTNVYTTDKIFRARAGDLSASSNSVSSWSNE
jgi:hypothetical protein